MNDRLVTIAKFVSAHEAETARSALEAAGVPAYLQSAELVAMAWHLSNAVGEVKLQVATDDIDAASGILTGVSTSTAADGESPVVQGARCEYCGIVLAAESVGCPACGADTPVDLSAAAPRPLDNEYQSRGSPLDAIRRNFRWLIWIWLAPVIASLGLGIVAMFMSLLQIVSGGTLNRADTTTAILSVAGLLAVIAVAARLRRRGDAL